MLTKFGALVEICEGLTGIYVRFEGALDVSPDGRSAQATGRITYPSGYGSETWSYQVDRKVHRVEFTDPADARWDFGHVWMDDDRLRLKGGDPAEYEFVIPR